MSHKLFSEVFMAFLFPKIKKKIKTIHFWWWWTKDYSLKFLNINNRNSFFFFSTSDPQKVKLSWSIIVSTLKIYLLLSFKPKSLFSFHDKTKIRLFKMTMHQFLMEFLSQLPSDNKGIRSGLCGSSSIHHDFSQPLLMAEADHMHSGKCWVGCSAQHTPLFCLGSCKDSLCSWPFMTACSNSGSQHWVPCGAGTRHGAAAGAPNFSATKGSEYHSCTFPEPLNHPAKDPTVSLHLRQKSISSRMIVLHERCFIPARNNFLLGCFCSCQDLLFIF